MAKKKKISKKINKTRKILHRPIGGGGYKKAGAKENLMARSYKSLQLRIDGYTYPQIAKIQKIAWGTAYRDVQRALKNYKALSETEAKEIKKIELERMDKLIVSLMKKVEEECEDPETKEKFTVTDYNAVDRIMKIMERRAKMMGVDAPVESKVEVEGELKVTAQEVKQIEDSLMQKLKRLAGEK